MSELSARIKWVEGAISIAQAGKHIVAIDRSASVGGTEAGFKAGELLLASVGGCLTSTLVGVASGREVTLTKLEISIDGVSAQNPGRLVEINLAIELAATDSIGNLLSEAELDKLVTLAERGCFVSNSIRDAIKLNVKRVNSFAPVLA